MRVGGHLSIGRGFSVMAREACRIGCESVQVFTRSPRGGAAKPLDESDVAQMRETLEGADIGPLVVHTPYFVSPANDKQEVGALATQMIVEDGIRAARLGAPYIVVHAGHRKKGEPEDATRAVVQRIGDAVRVLESEPETAGKVLVLLENGAGGRGDAAGSLMLWAACIKGASEAGFPLGGCLDTAHLWAAGWDLDPVRTERLVTAIEDAGILERLRVVHFNDSSVEAGSRKDRHVHIGDGVIPLPVFSALLGDPRLDGVAGIVETDPAGGGVARDVATLKQLRASAGQPG